MRRIMQTSDEPTLPARVRLRFATTTAACTTVLALLATPAATSAGQVDPQTGQAILSARQAARLEKLRADIRAGAARKALGAVAEPRYRRAVPMRPSWLAPKGQR